MNEVSGVLNIKGLDSDRAYAWLYCLASSLEKIGVKLEINDHRTEDGTLVVQYRITGKPKFVLESFQIFYVVMSCFSGAMAAMDMKPHDGYFHQIMMPILLSCREMYPELAIKNIAQEPEYNTLPAWTKNSRGDVH